MKELTLASLLVMAVAVTGCVNSPPRVSASTSLLTVNDIPRNVEPLSAAISSSIEGASSGQEVQVEGVNIKVLYDYTSALGLVCKRVVVTKGNQSAPYKTAACKSESGWHLSPNLM